MSTEPSQQPVATRRESVVAEIRRRVVLGTLKPGEKLREVKMAAELQVSRQTLREALNLLVQDGLLVLEPYRGLSVARMDAAAIQDIAQTRVSLDLMAVEAILRDPSGHRLDLVRQAWSTFEELAFNVDPLVQHDAHVNFHRSLWAASENSMLLRLWPVTEAVTTIVLAQDQAERADPARAHTIHSELIEAITSGDRPRVATMLTRHTLDSAQELLSMREGPREDCP